VVALSGDVHSAWAFEGPRPPRPDDPAGERDPAAAVEFVAPCVSATPMARQLPPGWRKLLGKVAEQLPEARWFELERHGFIVLEVDTEAVTAHWYAVDTEDPATAAEHCASWRNRLDAPGTLEPVVLDEPGRPLAPRAGPTATGPQVVVPGRPAPVFARAARGRRRRIATAAVAAGVATAAAVATAVRVRRR
jgi:hypothetical protein